MGDFSRRCYQMRKYASNHIKTWAFAPRLTRKNLVSRADLNECATGNNLCGPERCCRDLPPPPLTAPASARGYACAPYVASATGDRVCPTGFGPSASMVRSITYLCTSCILYFFFSLCTNRILMWMQTGNVATRPPIGVEFLNGEAILNLFEEARRGLIPILESPLTPALATVFAARAVNSPRRSQTLEGEEVSAQDRKQKRLEMAVKREELTAQKREAELRGALLQASKNFVKTQGKEQAAAKIVKSFTDHTSKALENEDYISAFESDEEESQVSSHKEEKKLASAERKARKEQEREALVEAKAAKREEKHLRQQQLQQRNAAKKDVYKPQRAKETREKESKKKPDFHISGSAIGGGQDLNQIDESVLNFIRVANQGKELQPRWITSDADEDDELVGEDHGARSGAGNVFVFDDLLYSQD